ncbi:MAG: tRNA (adenosine(37)-N6)-threonylcarbamoyltransferase complex dimerization subunit type 1 TsaB [Nitrospiraceae bacterium]|nr:MAG: tRNA (adenosine(37)-N6)-threonylcarbamoyltransferase complex dimerization subunit type 1 TsaB [Nitrospiraceae bacterium]
MKILAVETATIAGSVAILDDADGLVGEVRVDVKIAHAERLMPSIEWLLRSAGISINDIDAFAVSIGPGSFTGLRIGLSTVKGFSYAAGKPVVSVPTLDAFARALPFCSYVICPMLDARRDEVYAALYRWEGGACRKILPETVISPAELLRQINGPVVFTGDGVKIYSGLIQKIAGDRAVFAPASRMSPSASTVGEIALEKLKQGIVEDPAGLAPFYIRRSEAEIRWKG